MDVEVVPSLLDGRQDLVLGRIRYSSFSEHDLRDIEFELARRRAMSRRCPATDGEHTCALAPGHAAASHLCRGCTKTWQATG
jgi:hypothetical protein